MSTPIFRVQACWYDLIAARKKTYEGRPAIKVKDVTPGSYIIIREANCATPGATRPDLLCWIEDIITVDTLSDLPKMLPDIGRLIPGAKNIQDVINVYETYYPDIRTTRFAAMYITMVKPMGTTTRYPSQKVEN